MPDLRDLHLVRELRRTLPDANLIALSLMDPAEYGEVATAAGAEAFVSKASLECDLLPAIERRAARGPKNPEEHAMPTIVTYTDREPASNQYPQRIVSPSRPKSCCFTDMEEVGLAHRDERWEFQYRRCRQCGFTVRVLLREIPDTALAAELRQILTNAFVRNVPDL